MAAATTGVQTASAQETSIDSMGLEEIVVTARRKDESLQDVPTTINAVTGADIAELNIKQFQDIASVIPGMTMGTNANGIGATASVRGVNYEVNASGNNGTVEFYLNDAPISAGNLFQAVYDIQQVELLRGPQGTLRGRASPSGSMTVTTRRPDLAEVGGFVSATGNNIGGKNAQAAIGIPLITDMLAIRVAGAYDENEYNRVESINNPTDPEAETKSGRATVLFEPTGNLQFILTYQNTTNEIVGFDAVEWQQDVFPSRAINPHAGGPNPLGPTTIPPYVSWRQRLAVMDTPRTIKQEFENINLQAQWAFLGQKLNYVGAKNDQELTVFAPGDLGEYFMSGSNAAYQGFGQPTHSIAEATAHELRLSNEERVFDIVDYIVGAFTQKVDVPTTLQSQTPLFTPASAINYTPIERTGENEEKSVFANLTGHIGEALEISLGARYIEYASKGDLYQGVNRTLTPDAHEDTEDSTTIYTGSVKYAFNDDFMVYGTVGTSWRPAIAAVGDFSLDRSDQENNFLILPPEESTSYEVGFRSTWLDQRLRGNLSLYHQKFDNLPYRSPGGVWFIETFFNQGTGTNALRPSIFNFVAAVPAEVNGAEAEIDFSATESWDMGLSAAYAKGEIKDGVIPCNDLNDDGIPDAPGPNPTLGQLQAVLGTGTPGTQGDLGTIQSCQVSMPASSAPRWSGTVRTEYRLNITDSLGTFARLQASLYGDSDNDPLNPVDDVDSYALVNLYLGVRNADGDWEVTVYGKNVADTERVTRRASSVLTTRLNAGNQPTNYLGADNVGGLTYTPEREFGLMVNYNFGSR